MNWRLAARRAWHMPVVWVAGGEPPALTAGNDPVQVVVHVHYYAPVAGIDSGFPQPRAAITEGQRITQPGAQSAAPGPGPSGGSRYKRSRR